MNNGIPGWINVQAAIIALLAALMYAAFGAGVYLLLAVSSGLFLLAQPVIWIVGIVREGGA
jgi:ABC-type nickel/cobalt efflux system permease component RcnA